ncbi:tape-measure protein [Streptomyces sp. R302]|uniref:tape-measure protein n=1 Tax=unclassified Streptomyces TaxID=2593676 RepID=UPI00145CDB8D|nr:MULTISPECIES: tape-measure protein [unclassified Streptomyces]NML50342.1 tape-measure protein [Streptomyces sp. R301]NML79333.1 tape-measure protein [Streptomyces sp. R302]
MSAAALAPRLDPLAGVAGALTGFRTRLGEAGRALKGFGGSAHRAGSAVDGIRSGAASTGTALRQVRTRAEAAGRSLTKTGRTAGTTATRLKGTGTRARGATRPLNSIASGSGLFGSMAGLLGKASGTVSTLMGLLGGGLTVAAGAMTAVNVAMRANPLGFVLGLIVPLVAAIITFAMNSETGQKIMKQVFDQVLKVFRAIGKFLGPVIQAYAKVISTYFTVVRTIITGVVKVIGGALSKGFAGARSAISAATRAVTGLIRAAWGGFKKVLQPVLDWITKKIPDMFTRVKDAMSGTLRGIGDFVTTGMQNLLGVIKGPLNGLIAFANWVIDGLNSISVNILGKKFGVDLPKIPQLAEGGVVEPPSGGGPGSVRPLASLDRLRPAEAGHRTQAASRPAERVRLHAYHAAEGRGPLAVAADLLFLHRTAAA